MPELKEIATQLRRDIVRMVHQCQSGHPGGSLGCTDYLVALYFHVMKHNPDFNMDGKGEDPGYAVFGRVVEGMDVVRGILDLPRDDEAGEGAMKGQMLAPPVRILTVRRQP